MNIENSFVLVMSIFLVAFMLFHIMESNLIDYKMQKQLIKICIMILVGVVLEIVTVKINEGGFPASIKAHQLLKSIEIFIIPTEICYLACIIVKHEKWVTYYIRTVWTIAAILILINFFKPYMFMVNANNNYIKLKYIAIYFIIYIASICILLFQLFELTIKNQKEQYLSLTMITVFTLIEIIYMIVNQSLKIDWIVIVISYTMIYIYYLDVVLSIDHLTSLLNSRNYRNRIKTVNFDTAVIFIDCNRFKFINDKYGHHAGDIALKEYAKCIFEIYKNYGWVYRRSGDEFVVILRPGIVKMLAERNEEKDFNLEMKKLFKKLERSIALRSNKISYLKLGVSYGYGLYISRVSNDDYDSDSNSSEEAYSIDAAVDAADKYCYRVKLKKDALISSIEEELQEELARKKEDI